MQSNSTWLLVCLLALLGCAEQAPLEAPAADWLAISFDSSGLGVTKMGDIYGGSATLTNASQDEIVIASASLEPPSEVLFLADPAGERHDELRLDQTLPPGQSTQVPLRYSPRAGQAATVVELEVEFSSPGGAATQRLAIQIPATPE